jgi:HEAT repeat protein
MSIEQLRVALRDRDAEIRRRAVLSADQEPSLEVAEVVLSALGDDDWRVRKEAVQVALRRANELALIDPLVEAICQGENVGLRNAALDVLQGLGDQAARALVAALPGVPEHARKFVVEALGDSRGPLIVAELSRAAQSSDTNVASEAIEALARIGGPDAQRAIRSRLSASDPFLRMAALDALNRCEVSLRWEELAPLLKDRLLRRVVVTALGRTGEVDAVLPLFAALEDESQPVTAAAAVAIARLSAHSDEVEDAVQLALAQLSERARHALRGVLSTAPDPESQRAAAELLAEARDVPSLSMMVAHLATDAPMPRLIEALRDWGTQVIEPLLELCATLPSPRERAIALELCADLAFSDDRAAQVLRPRVLGALRESLSDREQSIRMVALRCLGEWGEPQDAPHLAAQAIASDPELARTAIRALEKLGGRSAEAVEQALAQISEEGSHGVLLATVTAGIGGQVALDRLQRLMSSDHAEVRRAAVAGLGRLGGGRAKSLLVIALADEDPDVQIVAAQALGGLRDPQTGAAYVDDLLLALGSELAHVRTAVARALGHTGSALAIAPLRELLRESESGVAIAAVEALGRLGPDQLAQRLEPALLHRDAEVVKAALRVLSDWRDHSAYDALTGALGHAAWDVRQLAAELLGDLGERRAVPSLSAQLAHESDDLVRIALSEAHVRLSEED